ncbi:hypothetical protein J4H86_17265 [Spiractinospora alimapuensis]|uniref:sensor histidine kinase n=1 Tax=Spiractinospora alimapuensis TaxID=2820884 RepID=UPI001F2D7B42|nr:histidine kinase [Spiractinospora alimapuensis]QVQ50642.1 hypothetical protein J4H86_17265 [Spiractinospora alimapuensis]
MDGPGQDDRGAPPGPECAWEEELRPAGVDGSLSRAYRVSLGLFAVAILVAAGVVSVWTEDAEPGGILLLVVAMAPWWTMVFARTDHGPTWGFAAATVAPVAALGFGWWPALPVELGGSALLTASVSMLLIVLLYSAFAPWRRAVGAIASCYLAWLVPAGTGWLVGGQAVDLTSVFLWHLGFLFCWAAGHAARFSFATSRELAAARVELTRREATEQRRQAAQEVHDVVAHTLAVTMLHITAARMAARRGDVAAAEDALQEAEAHGRASLTDIRRVVRLLRGGENTAPQPSLQDVPDLVAGYRAAGVPVDLSTTVTSVPANAGAELATYRVLQEALANAARHGTGGATASLEAVPGGIALAVRNPTRTGAADATPGTGVLGMRERATAAGGTMSAGVDDGGEWVVRAFLPVESDAAATREVTT